MNREIWQQLLSLQTADITEQLFYQIHKKRINSHRVKEINACTRQAREYFTNASESDFSVKPFLAYYGVASLSRSLILLLRPNGGEETLSVGHGLTTIDWGKQLLGNKTLGIEPLLSLRIRTCSGLFTDLINETKNKTCLHINDKATPFL